MKYVPPDLESAADASRGHLTPTDHAKNALAVAITLAALYFLLGLAADLTARWLPESWEARLGKLGMDAPGEQSPDRAGYERARRLLDRLLAAGPTRPLAYRLTVIPDDQPNAFAVPGGAIYVTRGLLEEVKSDAGLAFVLGHELGHHERRHTLRQMGRSLLGSLVVGLLFGQARSGAVDASSQLLALTYGRSQEIEADEFGLDRVKAALGSTAGTLEFFELMEMREWAILKWTAWASTHPLSSERKAHLKALAEKMK